MMLDDQGVTEEWIVRVEGREYGPANIETLREWKAEGRVLPANEARRADADLWSIAAEIPGLFNAQALPLSAPAADPFDKLKTGSAAAATSQLWSDFSGDVSDLSKRLFSIPCPYAAGVLPSVCSQLTTACGCKPAQASDADLRVLAAGSFAFLMFILSMAMWPVYVAGIQILTAEIAAGRRPGFFAVLNEAVRFWPRVAALCVFVYGVFFLLIVFALADRSYDRCRGVVVVSDPSRAGFAHPAGLDVWSLSSSTFFSGSSLPFSKTQESSIHCAKVEISRAAGASFRGFNVRCGAALSLRLSGLRLCWRSRSFRSGRRCSIRSMN